MENAHTPEAEALADAVLKAAGSGLRHYSMAKTRQAIFDAAQQGIDESRAELLEACRAQHEAIDRLFAHILTIDADFRPSQSGQPWVALIVGNNAIANTRRPA